MSKKVLVKTTGTVTVANTYYVATNGNTSNDGSAAYPWPSIAYALFKVGGGKTIIVRDGVYAGGVQVSQAGTLANPTIVRAENKWKARIIGSSEHGLSTADGCDYVVFDGFDVMGAARDGIKLNGNYGTARNCWVHQNRAMGISAHSKTGTLLERNITEFNGTSPTFHHGIYADGPDVIVRHNISRYNAAAGMQLWSSLSNAQVYGNYLNRNIGGEGLIIGGYAGGVANRIVNNTIMNHSLAIKVNRGQVEFIRNNILHTGANTDPQAAIYLVSGTVDADYNNCWPRSCVNDGAHGVSVDPQILFPRLGWLNTGSPMSNAGQAQSVFTEDFWGRALPALPWIGAFPYSLYLTQSAAIASWYNGEPYSYSPDAGQLLPDFWAVPTN